MIMKIVDIRPCYRITLENEFCGMETHISADSKIRIAFEDGDTLTGYIERVVYGHYPDENDTLIIRVEDDRLYILLGNQIKDIEELYE